MILELRVILRGVVRARGDEIVVMRPGDTVHTPPGEWHWHGAAPTTS
ncbi:cupin domain-containing protein [Nonomuraea sp. NPDC026600]